MNKFLLSTLIAVSLAGPALAGEGAGDPFPFSPPGENTTAGPQAFDVGQARLPVPPQHASTFNSVPTTQPNGQETEVATLNSLPRNALVGTVEYAQEQSIARYFASREGTHKVAVATRTRTGG